MSEVFGGYCRQPTLFGEEVVFCCEDALWSVPVKGGDAIRLTHGPTAASSPAFSPDGSTLAYIGVEEGNREIYLVPTTGGAARRLTYLGSNTSVVGWTADGSHVLATTNAGQPFDKLITAMQVSVSDGEVELLNLGPARWFANASSGANLLVRHVEDISRWKRYRGGRAGTLWVDAGGDGGYERIADLGGNVGRALWCGESIVFVSDHEGCGNLYRCSSDGSQLTRLTQHADFYVRSPSLHGERIIYCLGADLRRLDLASGSDEVVNLSLPGTRPGRSPKYVDAGRFLDGYDIHPRGDHVAVTTRGRLFTAGLWEGAVLQHGPPHVGRQRLMGYAADGESLLLVTDEPGRETVARLWPSENDRTEHYSWLDVGRPIRASLSPDGLALALVNHKDELHLAELSSESVALVDSSDHGPVRGLSWSSDSVWLAYGMPVSREISTIKVARRDEPGQPVSVTRPEFRDTNPAFAPSGRMLYFLSCREFDPVYEAVQLQLGFPRSMRLCLVTLQADVPDPFVPRPRPVHEKKRKTDAGSGKKNGETPLPTIEFEGIEDRVLAFPLGEGRFGSLAATDSHVFYSSLPVKGSKDRNWRRADPPTDASLRAFSLDTLQSEEIATKVSSFRLSPDGKSLIYRSARKLRVIAATGDKPPGNGERPTRKSGWIDLRRVSVRVDPPSEWAQMFEEAWRLMKDHFWAEDMGGVDWQAVRTRYRPLLERVASRSEFSDIMWQMQGELGTSHAYELGGDYPARPPARRGFLGADCSRQGDGWAVDRIFRGDSWTRDGSPLGRAGAEVAVGDTIAAINRRPLGPEWTLGQALVDQAGKWIEVTVHDGDNGGSRQITIKTLKSDRRARYREWVRSNRDLVHEASEGKIGYVHVPNMGPMGFAEFHRGYLAEVRRGAMLVDVRYNTGGHVSQLLIEKLMRRPVAYAHSRYSAPLPYPGRSVAGPIVILTNEYAGSDGDIFTHTCKLIGLGPVVGMRTWGGVTGILPRHRLVDKSMVTQPEFSHAFEDVGRGLENFGTEPDVAVEIEPQDWMRGNDPQLAAAIALCMDHIDRAEPPAALREVAD